MKKLLLLLLSVLVMVPALAQSKREQRETRRSERLEQQRVADSLAYEKERIRNATAIIVETPHTDYNGIFTSLAKILVRDGYNLKMADREIGIISTEPIYAGMATISLTFSLSSAGEEDKVMITATGKVHTNVGVRVGVLTSTTESADPITNKGMEGSALQIGWSEMLKYATYFGKTNITYK